MAATATERKLLIDGEWVETGEWLDVLSPYSGELVSRVAKGGAADVHRKGRKINTLVKGDFLGEIALVTGAPRTATVTTTAPSTMLVITARDFKALLRHMPSLQLKVLEALASRLPDE